MTAANRCTPCLERDHGRCTGSAGSVGCGCIHAVPAPVSMLGDWTTPPPAALRIPLDEGDGLDADRIVEHVADLQHERVVQQAVVDHMADLLDSCERALSATDRRLAGLLSHPAVQAALERGVR